MNRLLVLFPLLFAMSACNFNVTAIMPTANAPTAISQADPTHLLPQATFTFTPAPQTGTVTGKLSYPSSFIPPMRVVLFSLTGGKAYFVDTAKNQNTYSLDVPVGTYYVVSYPHEGTPGTTGVADSYTLSGGSSAGGYTQMVPCGLSADCTDHSLIPVTVEAGQTASANPGDWYAPEGTFPPMPNP
jgi:hypothetical protein